MPSHEKARELATKFEATYPETLPKRLTWWCHALGVMRPRLLRMMGLSAADATEQKDTTWTELFKNKELEENAWWVEGKLHDLLALFDYDWKALADRLQYCSDLARCHLRCRVILRHRRPVQSGTATDGVRVEDCTGFHRRDRGTHRR